MASQIGKPMKPTHRMGPYHSVVLVCACLAVPHALAAIQPVSLLGPEPEAALAGEQTTQADSSRDEDRRPIIEQPDAGTTDGLDPTGVETDATANTDSETPIGTNTLAGMLMAGGILIITFILMARLRRGKKRTAGSTLTTTEQIAEIRARAGDRNSIDAYKADAHDFTRRMAAVLDNKAERLEQLIADADLRLAELQKAKRGLRSDPWQENPDGTDHERAVPARNEQPNAKLEPMSKVDPMHAKVYSLADSGLDAISIARETGQPTGQIELILALR